MVPEHWSVVAVKFEMLGFHSALAAVWTAALECLSGLGRDF